MAGERGGRDEESGSRGCCRAYVDVNVFVYWLGGHPEYGERALKWIEEVERSPIGSFVTSSLTLYEVAVVLARLSGRSLRDPSLVETVLEAFSQLRGLKVAELTLTTFHEALELMGRYGLDLEDSIHLATALKYGASRIISNDEDFDKAPLERVF